MQFNARAYCLPSSKDYLIICSKYLLLESNIRKIDKLIIKYLFIIFHILNTKIFSFKVDEIQL
jgi:hypothetical protein